MITSGYSMPSPLARWPVHRWLRPLAAEGMAILVGEQRVGLVLDVAHRAIVLSRGRIVRSGAAAEITADPSLADLMAGG